VKTKNIAVPIFSEAYRYQHHRRVNPTLSPDLGVDRIQQYIGITPIKLPVLTDLNFLINLSNTAADKAAIYALQAQIHKQLVHLSSRNTDKVDFADDADQGSIDLFVLLQNRRVETTATELRDVYTYKPQSIAERLFALMVAIMVVSFAFRALI